MKTTTQHRTTWSHWYSSQSEAQLLATLADFTKALAEDGLSAQDYLECCLDIGLIASVLHQRQSEVA